MISFLFSRHELLLFRHTDRSTVSRENSFDLTKGISPEMILGQLRTTDNQSLQKEKVIIVHPNSNFQYDDFVQQLKSYLATHSSLELFFTTPVHYPLLWNTIQSAEDKIVLMEAIEGPANVFYYMPDAVQHERLSPMKQVGNMEGAYNVVEKLMSDLRHLGLQVNLEELKEVYKKISEGKYDELSIEKKGDHSQLRANFSVDDNLVRKSYQKNNTHLINYINPSLIRKYDIRRIILIGDYFKKAGSKAFLEKECQEHNLKIETLYDRDNILTQIAIGVGKMAFLKLDEQKKKALEKEQEQLAARNRLLNQIETDVKTPSLRSQYMQKFKEAAKKENVPFEIIKWHIENRLKAFELDEAIENVNRQLQKERIPLHWEEEHEQIEKHKPNDLEKEEESIIVDDDEHDNEQLKTDKTPANSNTQKQSPHKGKQEYPIGSIKVDSEEDDVGNDADQDDILEQQLLKELEAFEVTNFSWPENTEKTLELENIIQTERIYPNSEFILLKGKIKGSKIDRIFRIISTNELDRVENLQKFRRLYERVSRYYENVSKIFRSNFGLFYYRDYIEGIPLDQYIQRHKINQKKSLKELDSEDLKLIFHLWKEVKEMDFSYTNFEAYNILVAKKMTWNLTEEIAIKFVGLRSDVSSKEAMEDRLHEVLNELLYDGVYPAFQEKFL